MLGSLLNQLHTLKKLFVLTSFNTFENFTSDYQMMIGRPYSEFHHRVSWRWPLEYYFDQFYMYENLTSILYKVFKKTFMRLFFVKKNPVKKKTSIDLEYW